MKTLRLLFLLFAISLTGYVSIAQVNVGIHPQQTASGTDTYTATLSPAITAYTTGQRYAIKFTNANTGAATLNLNALGAKAIRKSGTTALTAGDIAAGEIKLLVYDGNNLQIVGGGGSSGGSSLTASLFLPGYSSIQTTSQLANSPATTGVELVNVGNILSQSDDIISNTVGYANVSGRGLMYRNMQWSVALGKYITPLLTASAYGSSCIEAGGEGSSLHASPVGSHFGDVPTMGFLTSANGARGLAGYTTGYVNHSINPLFMTYASTFGGLRNWNPSTSAEPLIHLHSLEQKGVTTDLNEYMRIEANGNGASVYGGLNFAASNGTYAVKTAISTSKVTGSIGSKIYDGSAYQKTADIRFVSRGTISSGVAAQSIAFITSSTNTAGLTGKFEIFHDVNKFYTVPVRFNYTAITTIPDYSANAGFAPVLDNSTVGQYQPLSTSTGGVLFNGFSTTSTASSASALWFRAVLGATAPTAPAMVFAAAKHNGTTNLTDLAATETAFQFKNNGTNLLSITGNGSLVLDRTVTAGGTTGAQTINKMSGTVNFAAGTSTLVVTNSLVTASSIVFPVMRTNDATSEVKSIVCGAGTFTINLTANTTAETSVGFFITN